MIKGIQQFQLRPVINREADALKTLEQVKDAGYEGIELCTFLIEQTSVGVRLLTKLAGMPIGSSGKLDWYKLIHASGLKVISIHEHLGTVLKETMQVVKRAKRYGTDRIVITGMHRLDYTDTKQLLELCHQLNQAGQVLKEHGIRLYYHNHNTEFRLTNQGEKAMDIILEHTDSELVFFELDAYWAAEAGCDVLQLMNKMGKRLKLLHISDRGSRDKKLGSIVKMDSVELGLGNLNLDGFVEKAKELDVEAVVLETHRNWINNSPIESMKISSNFMNEHIN